MTEPSSPRRWAPRRVPSTRTGVCLLSAAMMLGLAILSGWLTPRVGPGPCDPPSAPGAGQPLPAGPAMPAIPGAVPVQEGMASPTPEEPPTPAERIIDEAIAKVAQLKSVAAKVVETVDMLNQHLTIRGNYLKAPDHRVYLRLAVSGPPETGGQALQVCDGETLWDYQDVLETKSYRKFSIKPIVERLNSPELDPKIKEQALSQMGLAGPETLLVGLRQTFRFETREESTLDGKPVWILRGKWKSRQGLTGPDNRPVEQMKMLPPYIPGIVALYLGKDDAWPYKLVLQGQKPSVVMDLKAHPEMDTRKRGPDGRPIGSLSSIETVDPTKITLEYTDVKLNANINVAEFFFQAPPAASVEDSTEMIVKALDMAIKSQVDKKREEAARKDGTVLDQPLTVPELPGTPTSPGTPR